jgi:hypothetical protein
MMKTLLGILTLAVFLSAQNRTPQGSTSFSFPSLGVSLRMSVLPPEARAQIESLLQAHLQTLPDQVIDVTRRQSEFERLLEQPQVDYGKAELAVDTLIEARDRVAKAEALLLLRTRMALTTQQWNLATGRPPANEASATATLRTLNTAQITFAATYKKGFTDGLNRLGQPPGSRQPDENGADLVDPVLSGAAQGGNFSFTKNGYRFTYTPGPGGFGYIATYTIVAEPLQYGVGGTRSFFTDQSAVIRATTDNRQATAFDSPI